MREENLATKNFADALEGYAKKLRETKTSVEAERLAFDLKKDLVKFSRQVKQGCL